LNWAVEDGNGRELAKGYMTLGSPDIGMPGPFDVTAAVMRLPSVGTGVLRVFEPSAKDGSPINEVRVPIRFLCPSKDCAKEVTLHFQNTQKDPDMLDCSKTFAVTRKVFAEGRVGVIEAMSELLSGPTAFEKNKGYVTAIPEGVAPPSFDEYMGRDGMVFHEDIGKDVAGACRVTAIRTQIMGTAKASGFDGPVNVKVGDDLRSLEEFLQP
jgi:hypothetical protein